MIVFSHDLLTPSAVAVRAEGQVAAFLRLDLYATRKAMQSSRDTKKSMGRPATGQGTPVMVRIQPDQLAGLDGWISGQPAPVSRPEAIRRLIEIGLKHQSIKIDAEP